MSRACAILLALSLALPGTATATCPTPTEAPMSESPVTLGSGDARIEGILALPETPSVAAVLLLHGHGGTRDEFATPDGALFAVTARALAGAGLASLRIDFRGSGDSAGHWATTTLDGQARDTARAADFLATHPATAGRPLRLLGFSQGGLVALRAGALPGLDRVALWNPVLDPARTMSVLYGADIAGRAAATPPDAMVPGTGLHPAFFADLLQPDPVALAAALPLPLLIVSGDSDTSVPDGPAAAAALAAIRPAPTHTLSVAAGHDLGAARAPGQFVPALACTVEFLSAR